MTDIHFTVLTLIVAVSAIIPVLGHIFRTAFPMSTTFFLSGAMLLILFISVDNITVGQLHTTTNYNNSTDTIIDGYEPDNQPIKDVNGQPNTIGLIFIIASLSLIMMGVLVKWGY